MLQVTPKHKSSNGSWSFWRCATTQIKMFKNPLKPKKGAWIMMQTGKEWGSYRTWWWLDQSQNNNGTSSKSKKLHLYKSAHGAKDCVTVTERFASPDLWPLRIWAEGWWRSSFASRLSTSPSRPERRHFNLNMGVKSNQGVLKGPVDSPCVSSALRSLWRRSWRCAP